MKLSLPLFFIATTTIGLSLFPGCSDRQGTTSGKELFSVHCSGCHPDGSNTITPSKTLKTSDLAANMIASPEGIVQKMRNPGPGMPRFTDAMIPEDQAIKIGKYVLKSFK